MMTCRVAAQLKTHNGQNQEFTNEVTRSIELILTIKIALLAKTVSKKI